MKQQIINSPHKNFEETKHFTIDGIEYWVARELMVLLGYKNWRDFKNIIEKSIISCKKAGQSVHYHFAHVHKKIKIAPGSHKEALREVDDYQLSRYACYLIAQK